MIFSQIFSFDSALVELALADSDCVLEIFKFTTNIFVFVCCILKCLTKLLVLILTFLALSLKLSNFILKLRFFLVQLVYLFICRSYSGFFALKLL